MQDALACYALTPQGLTLARIAARCLHAEVFAHENLHATDAHSFHSLPMTFAQTFTQYQGHIVLGAVGMTVRCIAPLLTHKSVDPAVVVCDDAGRFAVSVLSGHVGRGNALAHRVAEALGAQAVVTTATDAQGLPSIDMLAQSAACTILDWDSVKTVNGALLRGEVVSLYDPLHALDCTDCAHLFSSCTTENILQDTRTAVFVHWRTIVPREGLLRIAVPALHVGVGCRKGVSAEHILDAVYTTLQQYGLEPKAVASLASVQAKEHEPGLVRAAQTLHVPILLYAPEELAEAPVLTPSAMAAQFFGVESVSVSEGAALLAAGNDAASLLVPKQRYHERVTVAVALRETWIV